MKLDEQVCSLPFARQLKKLGVKQESLFFWIGGDDLKTHIELGDKPLWLLAPDEEGASAPNAISISEGMASEEQLEDLFAYSAFTVAELGEMLPLGNISGKYQPGGWWCDHIDNDDEGDSGEHGVTEADARALRLIGLLENKLVAL